MNRLLLSAVVALLSIPSWSQPPVVQTGIDVLRDQKFAGLAGKRVGLITNPTGVDSRLRSTIDILFNAPAVRVVALFGPEHGVRGDHAAGDPVGTFTDSATGLPVYSLYGRTRKPTAEMLRGIDVLVYDIQDIGCRSYTYISTMGLAMEAAAEQRIPFLVLDRPNPLGGIRMEGAPVRHGFESFVSAHPIPYVYGLTCGELARMLNGEGLLAEGKRCSLTVVPMKGWKRDMTFSDTGLPWVPTSPHIPEPTTPAFYVSSGLLGELGVISEGVGYTLPFKVFAAPWINPKLLADRMNSLGLPGVIFRPMALKPFNGRFKDTELRGVQIHFTGNGPDDLMGLQFRFMEIHNELHPDKNPFTLADPSRLAMFDRVAGSDSLRILFTRRMKYGDVADVLKQGVKEFRERSGRYRLY
ncbi:MAG: DUF1343 domain-containing protein [Bacteroidota bacterium]